MGLGGGYGVSTPGRLTDNPGPWAVCFGEDFARFVSLPSMDYGVAHMYENNRGSWVSAAGLWQLHIPAAAKWEYPDREVVARA